LVSWWRAEGNALDSADSHHGYLTNGAAYASGHNGQAFRSDGRYAKVQFPNTTFGSLDITNDQLTVAAWINLATHSHPLGTVHVIFDKYWGPAPAQWNGYLFFVSNDGCLGLNLATIPHPDFWLIASSPVPTNRWLHAAATYDGQAVRLYANGQEIASAQQTGNILHNGLDAAIGSDNGGGGYGFNGALDEVMVYGRSLSPDAMENLYVAQGGPPRLRATTDPGAVRLSWPAAADGYTLEATTDLPSGGWQTVTNEATLGTNRKELLLSTAKASQRFFRLYKPGP
jgi:hypothetical protein